MGNIANTATVTGRTITRIGAIEGQEQQNPPAVHVNLELAEGEARGSVVLSLSLPDAIEMGLQLVAIGIEDNPQPDIDGYARSPSAAGLRSRPESPGLALKRLSENQISLEVEHCPPDRDLPSLSNISCEIPNAANNGITDRTSRGVSKESRFGKPRRREPCLWRCAP
jgi:hypothetical protein